MNFVEIVIDFYSHVSQTFASCTHYTSYSLLNFVHVIVCDFGLANQVLKIPWVLCKTCLLFENLRIIDWKPYFWEIWVQYKGFWRAFHLILMHFIHKILCFEEFLHKIAMFFKKCCFPDFQSIKLVAWSIESAIKILVWTWPFQSLLNCFWINWM